MNLRSLSLATLALLLSSAALAHDYRAGDIRIDHPYARATVAGQTSGSAYLAMENTGRQSDTLIAVQSPAAKSAEIHTMSMTADHVMRMREVDSIELKAQEVVKMQPGDGYHIMLIGLTAPLKAGDKLPLTLTFRKAGKVNVTVAVEAGKNSAAEAKHDEHHQH